MIIYDRNGIDKILFQNPTSDFTESAKVVPPLNMLVPISHSTDTRTLIIFKAPICGQLFALSSCPRPLTRPVAPLAPCNPVSAAAKLHAIRGSDISQVRGSHHEISINANNGLGKKPAELTTLEESRAAWSEAVLVRRSAPRSVVSGDTRSSPSALRIARNGYMLRGSDPKQCVSK